MRNRISADDVEKTALSNFEATVCELQRQSFFARTRDRAFDTAGNVAEIYHENTKYVRGGRLNAELTGEFQTEAFDRLHEHANPRYSGAPCVRLPAPEEERLGELGAGISNRRTIREFSDAAMSLGDVASLLGASLGVTGKNENLVVDRGLRAYPSAGALYPVELYLLANRISELDRGIYHYVPDDHELERLTRLDENADFPGNVVLADEPAFEDAAGMVVLTGVFPRITSKYGPRGYRYLLQESGHVMQNLQVVAERLDCMVVPIGGFDDRVLNEALGIDGVDEAAVYTGIVGEQP